MLLPSRHRRERRFQSDKPTISGYISQARIDYATITNILQISVASSNKNSFLAHIMCLL